MIVASGKQRRLLAVLKSAGRFVLIRSSKDVCLIECHQPLFKLKKSNKRTLLGLQAILATLALGQELPVQPLDGTT